MAFLDYYRSNPNWATSQWQSVAPPAPSFQPQPSWGGSDFYRAIAGQNYDGRTYSHAYGRIQGLGTQALASMGPSLIDAKLLHRRAYGGLGDILAMSPAEIGAAAAYEVWRNWRYNHGILAQPLGGDSMRQREALVGLAIGEATKLWQHTNRAWENRGRLAAVEAAAIAAARIFDEGNRFLIGGVGGYGAGPGMGMGALSPAISGVMGSGMGFAGVAGSAISPTPVAEPGMGMSGMSATAGGFAGPLIRQRSLSVGTAPDGYAYAAGSMPSYAGGNLGMYEGANSMLGVGTPIPHSGGGYGSSGGIEYGAPAEYGPGGFGETGISRLQRHHAERAAAKEARYRDRQSDGYYPPGRTYDDNYEYELGRGSYGSNYGDRYRYGGGYGEYEDSLYGGPSHGRHRRRRHSATRAAAERVADAFTPYGDGYGYGGRYGDRSY